MLENLKGFKNLIKTRIGNYLDREGREDYSLNNSYSGATGLGRVFRGEYLICDPNLRMMSLMFLLEKEVF